MVFHEYQCDPHSGAGNCVCGASERSFAHPHRYMRALRSGYDPPLCVCAQPEDAGIHIIGAMWLAAA